MSRSRTREGVLDVVLGVKTQLCNISVKVTPGKCADGRQAVSEKYEMPLHAIMAIIMFRRVPGLANWVQEPIGEWGRFAHVGPCA